MHIHGAQASQRARCQYSRCYSYGYMPNKLANRRTQFGTTVLVHLQERVLAQYKQSVADVIEPRVEGHTHTSMTNGILDAM